jgi:Xaa-Pro aminopeptidase
MFIAEEIAEKKRRVREFMAGNGFDALLIRRTANYAWLTGGGINYVSYVADLGASPLLFTDDGEYLVANNIEAARLREEELMEDQGYKLETYPWHRDSGEAEIIERLIAGGKSFAGDSPHPGAREVGGEIAKLRYSLTQWEVERYEWFGKKVSAAIEAVCATIRPGDRECGVSGRLVDLLWRDRIDNINNFCAADDRISRFRHPLPTERKIRDRVMLCVNARYKGLIITITRHVHFGPVPAELGKIYADNLRVDNLMMVNSVPGRPLAAPFLKGVEEYRRLGYEGEWELHNQGGGIGYLARDHRVSWTTKGDIQPHQAFSWNPSITGSKTEDVMIAAPGGVKLITRPITFPVLKCEVEGQILERPDILVL